VSELTDRGDRTDTPAVVRSLPFARRLWYRRFVICACCLTLVAGGLAFAVASELFPYRSLNHDEAVYLQQAAMLLEGQLVLRPPVEGAFRPWFFVDGGTSLYPKYSPVPAAFFALGLAVGVPQLSLAAIAAAIVLLTYVVVAEAFTRRVGVLAAAFVLASPLFILDTAVFLPYAPTAALNLAFAAAFLRADRIADRRRSLAYAVLAGGAIGLAFFARPYTAVLFAIPFVAYALWTLRDGSRDALVTSGVVALLGSSGVGLTLAYNAALTGGALRFPYEVFGPHDGLGFGTRAILGHEVVYTPTLALQANARILETFLTEWIAGGLIGALLALIGLCVLLARALGRIGSGKEADTDHWGEPDGRGGPDRRTETDHRTGISRRYGINPRTAAVVGVLVSVTVGNLYFWGNLNLLGALSIPDDGLIHYLGPYYHFDLLLPVSALAACGSLWTFDRLRSVLQARLPPAHARLSLAVVACLLAVSVAGGSAVAAEPHVRANAEVSDTYERAYAPFESRAFDEALVFLPTPYGPWLDHPFQPLRNDPGYDSEVLYAIEERPFAVIDAFPDRTLYRYSYRGRWAPTLGATVTPRLRPVETVAGERISLDATLGIPTDAERVSIRVATDDGQAYYGVRGTPRELPIEVVVAGGDVRVRGPVTPVGNPGVSTGARADVSVTVFVDYGTGTGFSYDLTLPVARGDAASADAGSTDTPGTDSADGMTRALSPAIEVCRRPLRCGSGAAYVPGTTRPGVFAETTLRADGTGVDGAESSRVESNGVESNGSNVTARPSIAAVTGVN
jgi:4-amino-4-deoxy-L-arabinose transferase-like glycosyltransferase